MEIKEGQIWKHKINDRFIHIKEVTRYLGERHTIAQIVTGEICEYVSDSKTTVMRQILTEKELSENFRLVEVCESCGHVMEVEE